MYFDYRSSKLLSSSCTVCCFNSAIPVFTQPEHFFCIFFWRARVFRPLLRLCRPLLIFKGCLDSNPETASWRASDLATHPSTQTKHVHAYLHPLHPICSTCGNQFPDGTGSQSKIRSASLAKNLQWTNSLLVLRIQNYLLGKEFLESSTMGDLCRVFNLEPEYRQRQKELGMDEGSRNEKIIF